MIKSGWLPAAISASNVHTYYRRSEWFEVACCPSNLTRMVASVGNYFYSMTPQRLYIHLYNQNHAQAVIGSNAVKVEQQTRYPWDGEVVVTLTIDQPTRFELALRIPSWCRDFRLEVNGMLCESTSERGYVIIEREWHTGDQITLSLTMTVERIIANPHIRQDAHCVTLQRGPVIYCLEEVDNGAELANITLPRTAALRYGFDSDLFDGIGTITGEALRSALESWSGKLYQPESKMENIQTSFVLKAIPYCFWANRQPGEMRVWIHEA